MVNIDLKLNCLIQNVHLVGGGVQTTDLQVKQFLDGERILFSLECPPRGRV